MGEIKITDIKNQRLQSFANSIDKDVVKGGNDNGIIDGSEISVFNDFTSKEELDDAGKQEYDRIIEGLGLELSRQSQEESDTKITEPNTVSTDVLEKGDSAKTSPYKNVIDQINLLELPVSLPTNKNLVSSDKASKDAKNWVKDEVKTAAKKAESINELKRIVLERKGEAPSRETSWNDAFIALMAVPQVKTRKDVEDLEKTMEATLKAQGRWNDVTKEVAKKAKEVAKKELIKVEFDGLLVQFEAKKAAEKAENYNFKQYLKDIKKGLGETKGNYKKEAFEKLENYVKNQSAKLNEGAAYASYWGEEAVKTDTSYKKTKENKHLDKIYQGKTAHKERTEALKKLTRKEIEDDLDKDVVKKLEDYMAEHFDETTRTYDLSGLVTDPKYGMDIYAGADATVNHHSDDGLDERSHIAHGLEAITGNKFSKGDVTNLRKFVVLQEQKRSRNVGEAAKDSVPYVAFATIAGIVCGITADQKMELIFNDKTLFNKVASQMGPSVIKDEASMKLVMHQFADLRWLQGLTTGVTTGLIKMATQLIFGKEVDEKTCFSVGAVANFNDMESLKKFVKAENPLKAEALLTMAQLFVDKSAGTLKEGTDDYKAAEKAGLIALYQALNKIAGPGSPLNSDECAVAAGELEKALEELKPYKPCKSVTNCEKIFDEKLTPGQEIPVETFHNGKNYQWIDLARMYDCLDNYDPGKNARGKKYSKYTFKTRFMKVLQGITDGNYDFFRIVELTKRSMDDTKEQTKMKNEPGFDYNKFMLFYKKDTGVGDDNGDIVTPLMLTVDGEVNCERNLDRLGQPTPVDRKGGRTNPGGTVGATQKGADSYSWTLSDTNGNVEQRGTDRESAERAIKAAEDNGCTVKRVKQKQN